jgi:hypothetical protein
MKKYLLSFLLIGLTLFGYSQTETIYFPDRPGFSCNPYSVGKHRTDYETSIGCNSNYGAGTHQFYQTNLMRFSMYEHLEFRFGLEFGNLIQPELPDVYGVRSVSFGVKIPIIKDIKYLPDIGILGQINFLGLGNPDFYLSVPQNYQAPQAVLLLSKGFGKFFILGNVGVWYDGYNPYANGLYSLCVCYSITPKFGTLIESYSFFNSKTSPLYFGDLGFNYYVTDNLMVDISCGNQYTFSLCSAELNVTNPFFVNCGISWRIPNKN